MFRLELLAPFQGAAFAHMTYAVHRGWLTGEYASGVALGLYEGNTPAALALARPDSKGDATQAELVSLFVKPALWGKSLGRQLLAQMELVLAQRGFACAFATHSSAGQCTAAWERLLAHCGWEPPRATLLELELDMPGVARGLQDWPDVAGPGEAYFPWSELSESERTELKPHAGEVTRGLWPLAAEGAPVDPVGSVGLRMGGKVVGWCIVHRASPTHLRCTNEFILPPWRTSRRSCLLFSEMGHRLSRHHPPDQRLTFAVTLDNRRMLRLTHRRMIPFSLSHHERRRSQKILHST